jgi:hypothetical protein
MPEQAKRDKTTSRQAAALAKRGARKGGLARAQALDPDERSDIARKAAKARWGNTVPAAPWAGALRIAGREFECAVLDDGRRVINQRQIDTMFGRTGGARRGPGARGLPVLSALNLQKFITPELHEMTESPVAYRLLGGVRAVGYPAEILPLVCEVYLEARQEDALTKNQEKVAVAAEILLRGLARIGIVALVDEATGYQEVRARAELQRILEAYVVAELRPWIKTFPDEFFREIYRLQGWEFRPGTSKRTPYVGKLLNKYVYEQLPPGVLDELRRRNPKNEQGHRSYKHHQFLTPETGNKHLDRQISTVTTLMRISSGKADFEDLFERAFPPLQPRLPLIIDVPDDEGT